MTKILGFKLQNILSNFDFKETPIKVLKILQNSNVQGFLKGKITKYYIEHLTFIIVFSIRIIYISS